MFFACTFISRQLCSLSIYLTHYLSFSYVDLSGNRIKRLTPPILSGLVNLKTLVLYNNRLHFKSYETPFINLTSLEVCVLLESGTETSDALSNIQSVNFSVCHV